MSDDREIEPWLGGARWSRSYGDHKYLNSVLAVASRSGTSARRGGRVFKGTLLGRGTAAAAALRMPGRHPSLRCRSGIVKSRLVRLGPHRMAAAFAHLEYITRAGVTRTGDRGLLYSADDERANGREFLHRCSNDRHQFRLMISPEDGAQYESMQPLVRRFMARMEDDLSTSLSWVGVDHCDTPHPHAHVLLRGKDDQGHNLVIAPHYFRYGMEERLSGLLSLDLGPTSTMEIARRHALEVQPEYLTQVDLRLIRDMDGEGIVAVRGRGMEEHCRLNARLQKLAALGLAKRLRAGRWQLSPDLEMKLGELGDRSERKRNMSRELNKAGIYRPIAEQVIHPNADQLELTGRIVSCGRRRDQEGDYLVIDGIDGRIHYVEIGATGAPMSLARGAIIRVSQPGANGRAGVERGETIQLLSPLPLEELSSRTGATWLDRELMAPTCAPRDLGFGREFRSALAQRRLWLVEQGLAATRDGRISCRSDMLAVLERQELAQTASAIALQTGLAFAPMHDGKHAEGVIRQRIELCSGRYAMIDDGFEFTLVPWQPLFDRGLGKTVSAAPGASGIRWSIGRERGIEI